MSCTETLNTIKIVLHDGEGKSKMCFNNPNRRKIKKIKVDDCLIKNGKRCDFMLIDHNNIEHFIELKGKQVQYACQQIIETFLTLKIDFKKTRHSFVVSSACPLTTTEIQVLKSKFRKNYNSTLTVKNVFCEHCLG